MSRPSPTSGGDGRARVAPALSLYDVLDLGTTSTVSTHDFRRRVWRFSKPDPEEPRPDRRAEYGREERARFSPDTQTDRVSGAHEAGARDIIYHRESCSFAPSTLLYARVTAAC